MIETLAALVVAHVAADFVFQTRWMAMNKASPGPLAAHVAVVWVASWVCLGCSALALAAATVVALVHLAMDMAKARMLGRTGLAYGLDQGVHLLTVTGVAITVPGIWHAGLWATQGPAASIILLISVAAMGAVFALRGGFYFVEHIIADSAALSSHADCAPTPAPSKAHRAIRTVAIPRRTLIENGVIFAGMLAMPLVVALAGLLRLGSLIWWSRARAAPRGSLISHAASLCWAVCAGFGTHLILGGLLALDAPGMEVYLPW